MRSKFNNYIVILITKTTLVRYWNCVSIVIIMTNFSYSYGKMTKIILGLLRGF